MTVQQLEADLMRAYAVPPGAVERHYAPYGAAERCDASDVIREVWAWNFDSEFSDMLAVVVACGGLGGCLVALDMEFPGFVVEEPRTCSRAFRYEVLRENVDRLWPVQVGIAVADSDGTLVGVWSFNLRFDAQNDPSSPTGMAFLRRAGLDFRRHLSDGIPVEHFGGRFAHSPMFGWHRQAPWWLTFSGSYDLGYLLKLLSCGSPLPTEAVAFDKAVSMVCPWRYDLRDQLPRGSLGTLGRRHGVPRKGAAHTAGSDALLTLELFLLTREATAWARLGLSGGYWGSEAIFPPVVPTDWLSMTSNWLQSKAPAAQEAPPGASLEQLVGVPWYGRSCGRGPL